MYRGAITLFGLPLKIESEQREPAWGCPGALKEILHFVRKFCILHAKKIGSLRHVEK